MLSKEVGPTITDAALHARYDKDIAGKPGEEEVHAKHILVDNEDQAKKIIADLKGGADFAALAKQYSKDPGAAQQGGDLGFFKKDEMVPEFATAAFAMKPGQVSQQPVHTQFGWHVIMVVERRPRRAADLRAGAGRAAPEDDPGRRPEGGRAGPRRGPGGEIQPGRLAGPRDRYRRTAAGAQEAIRSDRPEETSMAINVSPLAVPLPELPPIAGVRLGAVAAGIRYQGRTDLVMMELAAGHDGRRRVHLQQVPRRAGGLVPCRAAGGKARAVVVNAGNANVFTGKAGRDACAATAAAAAQAGRLPGRSRCSSPRPA